MTTEIILSYPWWWLPICLAGGFGLSWLLYSKHPFDTEQKGVRLLVNLLFVIRGLCLSAIAFLLLSPLIKTSERLLEKPVVVIAVDNSQSVVAGADSLEIKKDFPEKLKQLKEQLGDYEVRTILAGERVREDGEINFTDRISNLSELVGNVEQRYENRNLGALIIASDGLYNQGNNPQYALRNLTAPVFTIALGDTAIKKDLLINTVRHNKIAYLGNTFPLVVDVEARELAGIPAKLTVEQDGKKLFETTLNISDNRFTNSVELKLKAEKTGMAQYVVRLSNLKGELTYRNNTRNVFVEVLDARNKISVVARAPHPDIAALKQAIESNDNYEVETFYLSVNQKNPELKKSNLLILHDLPSQGKGTVLLAEADQLDLPQLFIISKEVEPNVYNPYSGGMNFNVSRREDNEVLPGFNPEFGLFGIDEDHINTLRKMPPLMAPYGTFAGIDPIHTLAYQQIGNVKTDFPLIAFSQTPQRKLGVIFGTGIWRWRLYDYEMNESHDATNELLGRIVQYLSVKNDKRPFRVNALKNSFLENERILFEAEVYNESYQLVNEPDVKLSIVDQEGKDFNYTFSKTGNAYTLDAGFLKPGSYSYTANVTTAGNNLQSSGRFVVMPLETELLQTTADHHLMYNLAAASGGKMYYPSNLQNLAEDLKKREELKPVSYYKSGLEDLISLKWPLYIFVGLLSIEWFLRKRNGGY